MIDLYGKLLLIDIHIMSNKNVVLRTTTPLSPKHSTSQSPKIGNYDDFASAHYLAHGQVYMGQIGKYQAIVQLQIKRIAQNIEKRIFSRWFRRYAFWPNQTHMNAHLVQMGKWPWCCTITDLHNFTEPVQWFPRYAQVHMGQIDKCASLNYMS